MRTDTGMPDRIRIRVSADEKRRMQEAARRLGRSLSDFVRDAVAAAVEKEAA